MTWIDMIKTLIEEVCFELRLSKCALSEILGAPWTQVFDWASGKADPIAKYACHIEWLLELSKKLNDDDKSNIWLWRNKKLATGNTILKSLQAGTANTKYLARLINDAINKWRDVPKIKLKGTPTRSNRELLMEESYPYANND